MEYDNNNNGTSGKIEITTIGSYSIDYNYTSVFNINQIRIAISSIVSKDTKASRSEMIINTNFDEHDLNNTSVANLLQLTIPQSTDKSISIIILFWYRIIIG